MLPKCSMYGIFTYMNGLNVLYSYLTNTTPFSTYMMVGARVVNDGMFWLLCLNHIVARHVIQGF